ncbi:hypothetical protein EB1_02600 [Empedobacter brevis NBRC 14943 = ATCC 43319]|uniref:Uncharacterized protein n=1 Tax=Empedobacter brevis NBRC 14943 = ATCC 43319 TaxID=1218108 RepID=A0A511NCC1_9FLAO|nr:hypothetical protein [Empedobacter brevis]GEM50470.1 hypothetical protein EB1_02600 [Empedobacter brevis NBRC 14943 = ATCC 43319]
MKNLPFKYAIILSVVASFECVNAQVGIGTDNPNPSSSLDISSQNTGVLIPRINLTATDLSTPINNPENSLLIFNTAQNGSGKNAVFPGYYYWLKKDGQTGEWIRLSLSQEEPWRIQNTTNVATANDQNIYQQGKVAVGFTETDAVSGKQMEIKGDFKTAYERVAQSVGIETSGAVSGSQSVNLYNRNTQVSGRGTTLDMTTSNITLRSGRSSVLGSSISILDNRLNVGARNDVASPLRSLLNIDFNPSSKEMTLYSIASSSPILTGNHFKSEIILDGARGIKFNFNTNGATGNEVNTDSYMFPRTVGTKGQVLVVGDIPSGASYTQLEWKNIAELKSDSHNRINYSNQLQDTGRKWMNGASIKELTTEITLDNSKNSIVLPKELELSPVTKIINVRLIHQESTRITNNVLSYNMNSRELIMEGEILPKGKYYLILEFFENI